MLRPRTMCPAFVLSALLAALMPIGLAAQDDPNDVPLGDVARTLRKKSPPAQNVIDDDNLSKVMEQAKNRHPTGSALKFLMAGEDKGFHVSAPDVTCSLAFTANVKSLLSSQYAQMELPAEETLKLEGPAAIEGDTLVVSVYNRTDWHVSEVAVALTVVKKAVRRDASLAMGETAYGAAILLPAVAASAPQEDEVRPEKNPDVTVIYRMRAAAPPAETAVFSARLTRQPAPDEEWHWAIVQARGYPPQSYAASMPQTMPQTAAQTGTPESARPTAPSTAQAPRNVPVNSPAQEPQ
jgi:hypothetical protein